MQVEVHELLQVRAHDLVRVNEDDLLEVHWEQDVKEENLISPDDALLLLLRTQPRRPFVCHQFVLEVIRLSQVRNEFLKEASAITFASEGL